MSIEWKREAAGRYTAEEGEIEIERVGRRWQVWHGGALWGSWNHDGPTKTYVPYDTLGEAQADVETHRFKGCI